MTQLASTASACQIAAGQLEWDRSLSSRQSALFTRASRWKSLALDRYDEFLRPGLTNREPTNLAFIYHMPPVHGLQPSEFEFVA